MKIQYFEDTDTLHIIFSKNLLPSHHRNIHSLNGVKGQSPFVGAQPPHPQKTNL